MATNPAGLLKEDRRKAGTPSKMGWETTFTHTPGSITATETGTGRAGMETMAGEGGTTPITAGAKITTPTVPRRKRGEGRGATAAMEGRDTGTTTRPAPLRRRPMTCEEEEWKKGGIAITIPTVHPKKEMGC